METFGAKGTEDSRLCRYRNDSNQDGAFRENLLTSARSSEALLLEWLLEFLPGIGGETSSWVAYGMAKRASKRPENFGKGELDLAFLHLKPPTMQLSVRAMIPMMVFGIPGDIVTAIPMSALIAQGLQPGPFLIIEHREIIYGLSSLF